jgi:flagellar export protein FliJ
MPFEFQLEGLLRVRRLFEQQAQQRLDESMMRLRGLERNLQDAVAWNAKTAGIAASAQSLPAAELIYIDNVMRQVRRAIERLRIELQEEERRAIELRAAYLKARRERRMVSALRDDARRRYELEAERREQDEVDEIFLSNLSHAHGSAASSDP